MSAGDRNDDSRIAGTTARTSDSGPPSVRMEPAPRGWRPARRACVAGLCLGVVPAIAWIGWGAAPSAPSSSFAAGGPGGPPSARRARPVPVLAAPINPVPVFFNSIGLQCVHVPAGSFVMGSPPTEEGRQTDETARRVTLSRALLMGRFEVTMREWRLFRPGHKTVPFKGVHITDADDQPAVNVARADAEEFCRWLSGLPAERAAGRVWRLPTEAEWEHAARAGTTTAFWWGDDVRPALFNFSDRNDPSGPPSDDRADDGIATTAPVGSYPPNPWGLHDMHGNVGEWVSDRYGRWTAAAVVDPKGPEKGNFAVERSGNWAADAEMARSAARLMRLPVTKGINIGFRVVCELPGR